MHNAKHRSILINTHYLQVSNVELQESDPKSPKTKRIADKNGDFKKSLERNPLMFSFQDGRVDELCPSDNEQTWALNIKRAIISAFQNSMDDFSHEQKTKEVGVHQMTSNRQYIAAQTEYVNTNWNNEQ